jgi:hypothetical protein
MMPFNRSLPLTIVRRRSTKIPRHAGAVEVCDLRDVDTEEVGFAADLVGERARRVTPVAVTLVQATHAKHVFGVAAALPVDR